MKTTTFKLAKLCLLLIPFLPACKKRILKITAFDFKESEARLFDIPFPIQKTVIYDSPEKIVFLSDMPAVNVVDFYLKNLEILGWDSVSDFDGRFFVYQKPDKYLAILIEDQKTGGKSSQVTLFISERRIYN